MNLVLYECCNNVVTDVDFKNCVQIQTEKLTKMGDHMAVGTKTPGLHSLSVDIFGISFFFVELAIWLSGQIVCLEALPTVVRFSLSAIVFYFLSMKVLLFVVGNSRCGLVAQRLGPSFWFFSQILFALQLALICLGFEALSSSDLIYFQ